MSNPAWLPDVVPPMCEECRQFYIRLRRFCTHWHHDQRNYPSRMPCWSSITSLYFAAAVEAALEHSSHMHGAMILQDLHVALISRRNRLPNAI